MAYLPIRGVDHYFEWIGDRTLSHQPHQPNPGKPVMVFLHGWGGSARYWRQTAYQLSTQFDCLLYDLRGFGRSRLPRPLPADVDTLGYELEGYADDLEQLLMALGIGTISINAHSAGASIAVFFLNRYPHRAKRAILTCHGIFDYQALAFSAFHFFGRYVVLFRPPWLAKIPGVDRMFMSRFLQQPISATDRREFLDDFLMADYEAALGTIYTSVSKRAAEVMPEEFRSLAIPTLLISGACDQIIPAQLGTNAAALNPLVNHVVMPNTGHFPMLEDELTYHSTVHEFLQNQEVMGPIVSR